MKLISFILLVSAIFCGESWSDSRKEFAVEDLNILFPVDGNNKVNGWPLSSVAQFGPLITERIFEKTSHSFVEGRNLSGFIAVGVRIDPCREGIDALACTSEIRLTAITKEDDDAAIHLIYELPRSEMQQLLIDYLNLKQKYRITSRYNILGVNSTIRRLGFSSAYLEKLRKLIFKHIGAERLAHVASFGFFGANDWSFQKMKITNAGKDFESIPIPNISKQNTFTDSDGFSHVQQNLFPRDFRLPIPTADQGLSANYYFDFRNRDSQKDIDHLVTLNRIENPRFSHADTVDCASCHASASFVKPEIRALNKTDQFITNITIDAEADDSKHLIDGDLDPEDLHQFSYFNHRQEVNMRPAVGAFMLNDAVRATQQANAIIPNLLPVTGLKTDNQKPLP